MNGGKNKVLILGFSCTALRDSFAGRIKSSLESSGRADVFLCGLGGLAPIIVPIAFERMRRLHGEFTHVILEISTSIYPQETRDREADARDMCRDIFRAIASTGARIAVLHLYRRYAKPLKLDFNRMLGEMARAWRAPVVDLAEGLVRSRGRSFAEELLRDDVHATPAGSQFQADQCLSQLSRWFSETGQIAKPIRTRFQRRAIPFTAYAEEAGRLSHQDYAFPYVRVLEGQSLVIDFPRPTLLFGFTFGYGLWGGEMEVQADARPAFKVVAIDANSFFERLGMRAFGRGARRPVSRLRFSQGSGVPPVKLRRGEVAPGPREARLMDMIEMSPCAADPR